jgi:hypothetical protein
MADLISCFIMGVMVFVLVASINALVREGSSNSSRSRLAGDGGRSLVAELSLKDDIGRLSAMLQNIKLEMD